MAANDPSSSLGFGGTAPEVRTVNPGKRVFCSTSEGMPGHLALC